MATIRPTQNKRAREFLQQEKQRERDAKRLLRKEKKRSSSDEASDPSIDTDLIGIYPGPQRPPED
jgi:hypothetical protein